MWRPASLLAAVKLNRLVDLDVQARHHLPRNLGDGCLVRIVGFFVSAAQAHEPLFNLQPLSFCQRQARFLRKIQSDRVRPDIDSARVNIPAIEEQQVAGFGSDIQQHRATFKIVVVIAKRVAQRRRRYIHQLQTQTRSFRGAKEPFDYVRFDRDQKNLQLPVRRCSQNLIIPHHFLQRKRHILLRLVLDNLSDLRRIDRRQLHEFRKGVKTGRAKIQILRPVRFLRQQLLQRLLCNHVPRGFSSLLPERAQPVLLQQQSPFIRNLEFGDLEVRGPKIDGQK